MLVNRVIFIGFTFVLTITLLLLGMNPVATAAVTMVIVMTGYTVISVMRNQSRVRLLDEACDPEAFLLRTEKQEAITGHKSRISELFAIDKAVAYMAMGDYERAKTLLIGFDSQKFSNNDTILAIHVIDLILCHYELGEVKEAESLFESRLPVLSPFQMRIKLATKILVGERLFYLGRYDESRTELTSLLKQAMTMRARLGILYKLAQIDEIQGDMTSAIKRYTKVANKANKLDIAEKAKMRLLSLTVYEDVV